MKKVLLVEDDASLRETLALGLSRDFQVQSAGDGPAALEVCRSFQPDVLVIDFALPGMDASEVCHRIEADAAYGSPRVIVMTGQYADTHTVDYQKKISEAFVVDAYFNKPFETEALIQRIRQLY